MSIYVENKCRLGTSDKLQHSNLDLVEQPHLDMERTLFSLGKLVAVCLRLSERLPGKEQGT